MVGNLVVVKEKGRAYVGEVTEKKDELLTVEVKHIKGDDIFLRLFPTAHVSEMRVIKKSSRPVKMKQQLSLEEEQQPTTL